MAIYNVSGKRLDLDVPSTKLAGVVIDATSETNRFLAMKQLFDIATKKLLYPSYTPTASDFTYASKGIVCVLPDNPAMYEQYDFDALYEKNSAVQGIPASITKVAALVAAMPFVRSIKDKVTLEAGDIQSGSGNYFSAGDVLSIEDLMYGMMLPSSNTCAAALAHHCGKIILGNNSATAASCISAFVGEMNAKAVKLGCTNTAFDSPSGLSKTNKSTASDMLRFLVAASAVPEICSIWNKKSYNVAVGGSNARTVALTTTVSNQTLEAAYYIFGGKTGHLDNAADALVMIAAAKE